MLINAAPSATGLQVRWCSNTTQLNFGNDIISTDSDYKRYVICLDTENLIEEITITDYGVDTDRIKLEKQRETNRFDSNRCN